MKNLRQTTRIDTRYIVIARTGNGKTPDNEIRAMIINISLDGALIETAERLTCRSLVLTNIFRNETVSIHAKVIHHLDVEHEDRVLGPYRTGLHFMNNVDGAKDFIISIIKAQEKESEEYKKNQGAPPEWMDTGQINLALFSTDSYEDDMLELPEVLEPLSERSSWMEDEPAEENEPISLQMERPVPEPKPVAPAPKPFRPEPKPVIPAMQVKPPAAITPGYRPPAPHAAETEKNRKNPALVPVVTGLMVIVLLALILISRSPVNQGAGSASFFERLGIDIPFLSERPIMPKADGPDGGPVESEIPAHLDKDSIQGHMVYNEKLGPLFVIRGFLTLQPGHRVEEINIVGKILNKNSELIDSMTVWPGNKVDDSQIALFDTTDLKNVAGFSPNRGFYERVPFIMVFSELPQDTQSFSVDLKFIHL